MPCQQSLSEFADMLSTALDEDDSIPRLLKQSGHIKGQKLEAHIGRLELAMKHQVTMNAAPPISSLSRMLIRECMALLAEGAQVIAGGVIFARVFGSRATLTPFRGVISCLVRDEEGTAAAVIIQNCALPGTQLEVEQRFPLGMQLALKEPVLQMSRAGGLPVFVLGSPANAVALSFLSTHKLESLINANATMLLAEGNEMLSRMFLDSAVELFEMSATQALQETGSSQKLLAARECKAWCFLQAGKPELALQEAEVALQAEGNHLRCNKIKASALMELELYAWARDVVQDTLASPEATEDLRGLDAVEAFARQSTAASLLLEELRRECASSGNVASRALGVKIQLCCEPGLGRGLFSSRCFTKSEIVLVSKPLIKLSSSSSNEAWDAKNMNLAISLMQKAMRSKRAYNQIFHLGAHQQVPEMEEFAPNWTTAAEFEEMMFEKPQEYGVELELVRDVVKTKIPGHAKSSGFSGKSHMLWPLAGFINHSCQPNTFMLCLDDAFVAVALRDIGVGEEITISYVSLAYPLIRERLDAQGICCSCWRCKFEDKHLGEFNKLYFNPEVEGLEAFGLKPEVPGMKFRLNSLFAVQQLEQLLEEHFVKNEGSKQVVRCSYWELYYKCYCDHRGRRLDRVPAADLIMKALRKHSRGSVGLVAALNTLSEFAVNEEHAQKLVDKAKKDVGE